MSRRSREAAAQAAAQSSNSAAASDAGRVLQAQRQESNEPAPEGDGQVRTEGAGRPEPRNEPRRLAMQEIVDRHHETSGYEPVDPAKPKKVVEEQAPDPVPLTPEAILANNVEQPTTPVDPVVSAPEPVPTVKMKVNGQEFYVPQAEIDEAGGEKVYRLNKAAELHMENAKRIAAETRQQQAQLVQWIQAQQPKAPPPPSMNEMIAKAAQARFGTDEEFTAAMSELMTAQAKPVDTNAITMQAVSVMQKTAAIDNFKKEFQDVVSNPMLLRLAASLETDFMQQGQPSDWQAFYRGLGNQVRSVVSGRQPQAPAAVPATLATLSPGTPSPVATDREARKSSIVNLPTASARAALPAESKPKSREDILNDYKKSRGIQIG